MEKIKRLAWLLCFFFACGLLVLSGSTQLEKLASTHHGVSFYLLLSLFVAIPMRLSREPQAAELQSMQY